MVCDGYYTGFVQAWISWRDRLQHEAVCRGIHAKARQAVQEVCFSELNLEKCLPIPCILYLRQSCCLNIFQVAV